MTACEEIKNQENPSLDHYFAEGSIHQVVADIKNKGYAQIDNFFENDLVSELMDFINSRSQEKELLNFSLREEELKESIIERLAHATPLSNLMYDVSIALGEKTDRKSYYSRVRVKLGNETSVDEGDMHFDGSFLTFVIPVVLPEAGQGGGLRIVPKARPFIKNSLFNRISRRFYSTGLPGLQWLKKRWSRSIEVYYRPQSLFVFEGWTTLHATAQMARDAKRVVILIHSGDVEI